MKTISISRFGSALGVSSTLLYLGCVFFMATVNKETVIKFSNSLFHGLDVSTIIRWEIPWTETVIGVFETFLLGWLFGAMIAAIYNFRAG